MDNPRDSRAPGHWLQPTMITVWSQGRANENMPETMLVETLANVRRHPWWRARARLALSLIKANGFCPPDSVLDVGCGWGVNLEILEDAQYHVTGLDVSRQILELIDRPNRHLIQADLNQSPPLSHKFYSILLLLDVIEHLDDDRGTITQLAALAKPGALLLVSVPALPDLFSEFDVIQGHRRRYMPETLRAAFDDTGFAIERIFWWGAWMVPVIRWVRQQKASPNPKTYSDYLRLPPWPAPLLMRALYSWEQGRAIAGRLSVGTTLFAVARRAN